MIFQILWPPTHAIGVAQAALARWFRAGTFSERVMLFPFWLVCRLMFMGLYAACEAVA